MNPLPISNLHPAQLFRRSAAATRLPELRICPMTEEHLGAVHALEKASQENPWTIGNFRDSITAGYFASVLMANKQILAHIVAMQVVDEMHLLNVAVHPGYRRHGLGHLMLDALDTHACRQGIVSIWLEVRASNARAISVYTAHGYRKVGMRRGYYPPSRAKPEGEDAIIMSMDLNPGTQDAP